jgi:DNA-binding NarL/FixJ family response regulator
MPIRVAIIDGHTLTRYGLRELVAQHSDIEIVAECQSAVDAPRMIVTAQPDVVTVEVKLPDGDGLQLAREFRDRYADLGIVVLTSQHEDDVLFRALETGVSAFVAKTAPLEEMLAAIRHAAVAASSFTASGLATAIARRRTVQDRLALSPREAEVLRLLRDGLSIPAIALAMFISQSTAKTYVARLYDKLGAANRSQALMTAMHYGLINYQQDPPRPAPLSRRAGRAVSAGPFAPRSQSADSLPAGQHAGPRSLRPGNNPLGMDISRAPDDWEVLRNGSRPVAREAGRRLCHPGGLRAAAGPSRSSSAPPGWWVPRGARPAVSRLAPRAGRLMPGECRCPCVRISAVAA